MFLIGLIFLLSTVWTAIADDEDYIPMYSEEELTTLFENVEQYMENNEQLIESKLDKQENQLVTIAFTKAWGILEYDDATEKQIDDAYKGLFSSFIFMGMITEWKDKLTTDPEAAETLFNTARQMIDQEYYDILTELDEEDHVKTAKRVRDEIEQLADHPNQFSRGKKDQILKDTWDEIYNASMLRSIEYLQELPEMEDLFPNESPDMEDIEGETTNLSNPVVPVNSIQDLSNLLGFDFPDLTDETGCSVKEYAIIGKTLAQGVYSCEEGEMTVRIMEGDSNISGVYGKEQEDEWLLKNTLAVYSTYENYEIVEGAVEQNDYDIFSFSIVLDGSGKNAIERWAALVVDSIDITR